MEHALTKDPVIFRLLNDTIEQRIKNAAQLPFQLNLISKIKLKKSVFLGDK